MKVTKYIANQETPEGVDEIQQVLLAFANDDHIALAGPPGVGKTDLIWQLGTALNREIFEISCDKLMTEAPLVGMPALEGNGSTQTVWKNGVATKAAAQGGIAYLDETDQLDGSVQKRLNPLHDDRRHITRRDGTVIEAEDGFVTAMSYNPSDRMARSELEDSVADRMIHIFFEYLPVELMGAIITKDKEYIATLEDRACHIADDSARFYVKKGDSWTNMYDDTEVELPEGTIEYKFFPRDLSYIAPTPLERKAFGYKLSEFVGIIYEFAENGTNNLDDQVKTALSNTGEFSQVRLHKPSLRILRIAMNQYDALVANGMEPHKAQSYATRVVINQTAYGKNGRRKLGSDNNLKVYDGVVQIAQALGLIGQHQQTASMGGP